eukprot:gnl/TRDRNA2_/TRDRNA2_85014_c0_seq1.p1 gnl/TRDRNA2_/TRDRNA2_85014_c0~~gnl/TRDRNA2_/TRDRNA2_85014_c0_seq1.p1  ORF type:complete len:838 (-),score=148.97 gnl/TRDRNA2_/TRDRNA2_85014_c0_seq1:110-2557(-)
MAADYDVDAAAVDVGDFERLREQYAALRARFAQLEQLKARTMVDEAYGYLADMQPQQQHQPQQVAPASEPATASRNSISMSTEDVLRELCQKINDQSKEINDLRAQICGERGSATESVDVAIPTPTPPLSAKSAKDKFTANLLQGHKDGSLDKIALELDEAELDAAEATYLKLLHDRSSTSETRNDTEKQPSARSISSIGAVVYGCPPSAPTLPSPTYAEPEVESFAVDAERADHLAEQINLSFGDGTSPSHASPNCPLDDAILCTNSRPASLEFACEDTLTIGLKQSVEEMGNLVQKVLSSGCAMEERLAKYEADAKQELSMRANEAAYAAKAPLYEADVALRSPEPNGHSARLSPRDSHNHGDQLSLHVLRDDVLVSTFSPRAAIAAVGSTSLPMANFRTRAKSASTASRSISPIATVRPPPNCRSTGCSTPPAPGIPRPASSLPACSTPPALAQLKRSGRVCAPPPYFFGVLRDSQSDMAMFDDVHRAADQDRSAPVTLRRTSSKPGASTPPYFLGMLHGKQPDNTDQDRPSSSCVPSRERGRSSTPPPPVTLRQTSCISGCMTPPSVTTVIRTSTVTGCSTPPAQGTLRRTSSLGPCYSGSSTPNTQLVEAARRTLVTPRAAHIPPLSDAAKPGAVFGNGCGMYTPPAPGIALHQAQPFCHTPPQSPRRQSPLQHAPAPAAVFSRRSQAVTPPPSRSLATSHQTPPAPHARSTALRSATPPPSAQGSLVMAPGNRSATPQQAARGQPRPAQVAKAATPKQPAFVPVAAPQAAWARQSVVRAVQPMVVLPMATAGGSTLACPGPRYASRSNA